MSAFHSAILARLRAVRYVVGRLWPKQRWLVRRIKDTDDVDNLLAWTQRMRRAGWDDMAAFGDRLYLRKFVPRFRR